MKCLVTGGTGFIGSHLIEALLAKDMQVTTLVQYTFNGDLGWIDHLKDGVNIIYGDIRDPGTVARAVHGNDCVLHLAASISIPYSYQNPREVIETNVLGTLNVLEATRAYGSRMIHTSTSEVFGTPKTVPINEQHPVKPQSPYAASKAAADRICEAYRCSYGLPITILRPFNTFGPRQSPRAIIPWIILQLLDGDTVKLGNLDPTRDFTYVKDTVSAMVLATQAKIDEELNLGTGRDIRMGDLVQLIARLMDKEAKIEITEGQKRPFGSEVMKLQSDNQLAQKLLGWKPAWNLEDGLRETISWFKENRELYKNTNYP